MRRPSTLTTLLAGAALGVLSSLALMAVAGRQAASAPDTTSAVPSWRPARLLAEALGRIKRDYVDEVDDRKLVADAVRGMAEGLDSHSTYLDPQEFDETRRDAEGAYPGLGIEVAPEAGTVRIVDALPGSPAERAGLRAGDLIARIDGMEVGSDVRAAIARLRGGAGTTARLSVQRPGSAAPLEFSVVRERIEMRSVTAEPLAGGYGYVRISGFNDTTAGELEDAVVRLRRSRTALRGLVLDLRGNPGGVLEAGVAVADDFLDRGVIVTADGRGPEARFRMDATPGDIVGGAPLALLVDGGTASAAEIVAGALKDHARAVLVGDRTYGKGTVQTVAPLSQGALKLTTSRYFTPAGSSIDERGIVPDVYAPQAAPGRAPDSAADPAADPGPDPQHGASSDEPPPAAAVPALPPADDPVVQLALRLLAGGAPPAASAVRLPPP